MLRLSLCYEEVSPAIKHCKVVPRSSRDAPARAEDPLSPGPLTGPERLQ